MNEFFSFQKMITPTIIKIIFWIGIVTSLLTGLGTLIFGFVTAAAVSSQGQSGVGVLIVFGCLIGGVLEAAFGIFLIRVWCEIVILAFRIYDRLSEIRDNTAVRLPTPAPLPAPAPGVTYSAGAGTFPV